jgi:nicotinate-nucleotide pyrophosphorylase (carboxylating)
VRLGGGLNHRLGLYDAVLIKENHAAACGGVAQAARRARQEAEKSGQLVPIFAEARTLDEVRLLIEALPDRILLDNMAPQTMGRAVALIRAASPHIQIEATGGFNLHNVRQAAQAGVDLISIGALTHSAPALDLSMLFEQA